MDPRVEPVDDEEIFFNYLVYSAQASAKRGASVSEIATSPQASPSPYYRVRQVP